MKGLLLKDFYSLLKNCRYLMLIIIVFIAVSCFGNNNLFFIYYPTLFASMIPVTLISYDEREKWNIYALSLPYTKAQFVSSKYLIGLLFELTVFILSAVAQAFRMISTNSFLAKEYFSLILSIFVIGLIGPSFLLPFIFKFGSEKGRIAYLVVIGVLCAGASVLVSMKLGAAELSNISSILILITAITIVIFSVSWYLSIMIYRKREL